MRTEQMKIKNKKIGLASTKGGAGKSQTCKQLAAAYEAMGLRVLILDTDENNNSLNWVDIRSENMETTIVARDVKTTNDVQRQNIDEFDIVLVDVAGTATSLTKSLIEWCDIVIVPTFCDIDTCNETADTFEIVSNYGGTAKVLRIYDIDNKIDNSDADKFFKEENISTFKTILRKSRGISRLAKEGKAPADIKTKWFMGRSEGNDARADLKSIIKEINK
jgi:cellulose biosynthesis protein BcsQ